MKDATWERKINQNHYDTTTTKNGYIKTIPQILEKKKICRQKITTANPSAITSFRCYLFL
jgi:hypothetical protein